MIIKKHYYDVPKCPKCNSLKTGIIMFGNPDDKRTIIKELKNANYVYLYEDYQKDDPNCFCVNCGFTWKARVKTIWLTPEQIAQKAIEKGINRKLVKNTSAFLSKRKEESEKYYKEQKKSAILIKKMKEKGIDIIKSFL